MAEQETPPQTTADLEGSKQVPKTSPLSVHNTYELLREVAARNPEKTAIVLPATEEKADQQRQHLSYGALLNGIHQTANLLADLCVEPRDVIALLLPNLLETHLLLWGGQTVGIVCPIPLGFSLEETVALLRVVKAKVLVAPGPEVNQDLWPKAEKARRDVKSITTVLQVRGPGNERNAVYAFNTLLGDYSASYLQIQREIAPEDIAVSLPVRSTTGIPSLVSLTHKDLLYLARAIGNILRRAPEEVLLRSLWQFIQ